MMTTFFRLLDDEKKERSLKDAIASLQRSEVEGNTYTISADSFLGIPGATFSYWVSAKVRNSFETFDGTEGSTRSAKQGLATSDDFRFLRLFWEVTSEDWVLFAKGGEYSQYYSDVHLVVNWSSLGDEIRANLNDKGGIRSNIWMLDETIANYFLRPGITWPRRTQKGLGMRVLPKGCFFGDKGPTLFERTNNEDELLATLAMVCSSPYKYLVSLQMCFGSYEVGVIAKTPMPSLYEENIRYLSSRTKRIWNLKYQLDSINENSHAYRLPNLLAKIDGESIIEEINSLQREINNYAFELFDFSAADKDLALAASEEEVEVYEASSAEDDYIRLVSWAVGVVFGRFDSSKVCSSFVDLDPFKKTSYVTLDKRSVEESMSSIAGVATNDENSRYSLHHLVSNVLDQVGQPVDTNLGKVLSKDFFDHHLKEYSKSRRVAPIYWPIETKKRSFTIWLHYNDLNQQTLLTCVVDILEPKLEEIEKDISSLSQLISRTSKDEKQLNELSSLKGEIVDLKEELLRISKFWRPNFNDGVQIIAAPLWRLLQHKTWQKKLKETWEKLEDGEYDWAHLAYTTWPERVLKKCHTDRSIAIAHGVEADLWHEVEVLKGKKKEPVWEWQPKPLSPVELNDYVREKIATDERLALYRSNAKNSGVK